MCPCEARAENSATCTGIDSATRSLVTAATDGVRSVRLRVRDRIVGSTSERVGAQSNQTVRSPGSSIALSSAFAADSVRRSASSIITTRYCATDGVHEARVIKSRTSSILMERPSVFINSTSAWVPRSAVVQLMQLLHPESGQISAAAKARAVLLRPDPGGPVKSQACTIFCDSSELSLAAIVASLSIATVSS